MSLFPCVSRFRSCCGVPPERYRPCCRSPEVFPIIPTPLRSISRRVFLASTALAGLALDVQARTYVGGSLPTVPGAADIPARIASGPSFAGCFYLVVVTR